jgi:hypothetical protein
LADPSAIATKRADAMLRITAAADRLAAALPTKPPDRPELWAARDPALREARTLEGLADFLERAAAVADEANRVLSGLRGELAAIKSQADEAEAECNRIREEAASKGGRKK